MSNKLSGRMLDAAIAEHVMRWHEQVDYDYSPPQINWVTANGEFIEIKYDVRNPENVNSLWGWCPSESIKAAMQVVEKMREQGWSFACTLYEGKLPYASFCKGTARSSRNADADTLPLAICRAALATVKTQSNETPD